MYPYLQQLDCYNKLKEKVPDMLSVLEEQIRWYEEDATDEDIGNGEYLTLFLLTIYSGSSIDEWLELVE
jgi:hypothetical protein